MILEQTALLLLAATVQWFMLTTIRTVDGQIDMLIRVKGQTTITLQPILPLFLKGQRHTIDQPHTMKIHTGTTVVMGTILTTTAHMGECITGLTLHGTADIKLVIQMQ
jgi:hypothetical protein